MGKYHTVKQGDYLGKIASQYGFSDWKVIWDHEENAGLKEKRKNPNVLYPGDKLFIPDKEIKEDAGSTEQQHTYKKIGKPLMLRIVVKDPKDNPIANTSCVLQIDGVNYQLTTDGNGLLEQKIPPSAKSGKLSISNLEIPIKIGFLDPIDEVKGWQARLKNLGYYLGKIDGKAGNLSRSAVKKFQSDNGLEVDGICGPITQGKLQEVHGC